MPKVTPQPISVDMDLHHPPCRCFRANQAFNLCGQFAQMPLSGLQYRVLTPDDTGFVR